MSCIALPINLPRFMNHFRILIVVWFSVRMSLEKHILPEVYKNLKALVFGILLSPMIYRKRFT